MPYKKNITTWLDFIASASLDQYNVADLQMDGIKNILAVDSHFNDFFYHSVPAIYMLDYTSGKYVTMSKSSEITMGHSSKTFLDGGISFTIDNYHPEDLKIYNEKIFPERLQMMKKFDREDYHKYIFSYTFRLKNSNGTYRNLLQRNCYIKSANTSMPLASFGIVINIGHFLHENPVIQTIEKLNSDNQISPIETISRKSYFIRDEDQVFSKREKEILLWTAEGFTSKEIAKKLSVSESTVINHRKNMLLKCGAKNMAELVAFSFKNHII